MQIHPDFFNTLWHDLYIYMFICICIYIQIYIIGKFKETFILSVSKNDCFVKYFFGFRLHRLNVTFNNTDVTYYLITLLLACSNIVEIDFIRKIRKMPMGFTSEFLVQLWLVTYHHLCPSTFYITSMTGSPLLQHLIFAFS
jgi:hypothetical protein